MDENEIRAELLFWMKAARPDRAKELAALMAAPMDDPSDVWVRALADVIEVQTTSDAVQLIGEGVLAALVEGSSAVLNGVARAAGSNERMAMALHAATEHRSGSSGLPLPWELLGRELVIKEYIRNLAGTQESGWNFWAWELVESLVWDYPAEAFSVVRELIEREPDEFVGSVAAGPLEELVARHGAELIEMIEETARSSERFRKALRMMDISDVDALLQRRVMSASRPANS